MQFKRGEFHQYRTTRTVHLGQTAENIPEGEIIEYDGTTLIREDGNEITVTSLKGAVNMGWVVPADDTESVYEQVSAGVEIHSPTQTGNDKRASLKHAIVADDMQEIGTIADRKAHREQAAQDADRRGPLRSAASAPAETDPAPSRTRVPARTRATRASRTAVAVAGAHEPDNDLVRELDEVLGVDTAGALKEGAEPEPAPAPRRAAPARKMAVTTRDSQEVARAVKRQPTKSEGPIRGVEAVTQSTEGQTIRGTEAKVGRRPNFAGADQPAGPTTVTSRGREIIESDNEGVAIASLGSSKFKTNLMDGNQGKTVRSVRPQMEKTAHAKHQEAIALGRAIQNGDIAGELLERLDPVKKAAALAAMDEEDGFAPAEEAEPDWDNMTVKERAAARRAQADASVASVVATGDVEEAMAGDDLIDLLPDAVSTGTPDPGEAGEGDDPHLTAEEKASASNPAIEAIRAFVPDFDWDLSRPWKSRVSDAVKNHGDDPMWLKGILSVESDSVKKHIQAALEARSA